MAYIKAKLRAYIKISPKQSSLGVGLLSSQDGQVALGRYNQEDKQKLYALILGWGESVTDRKNVHTVSVHGDGWYRGRLYVGGSSQEEGTQVATQDDTQQLESELQFLRSRVDTLHGQEIRLFFQVPEGTVVTSSVIEAFVISSGYPATGPVSWDAIGVVQSDNNNLWAYFPGSGWTTQGTTTIVEFSNDYYGLIKGSLEDGCVSSFEGVGRVSGWAQLKERVAHNEQVLTANGLELERLDNSKLDKVTGAFRVYATGGNGVQTTHPLSAGLMKSSVPFRKSNGAIETGPALDESDAVPLAQLNEILDNRIGDVSAALDELHAYAEVLVGGATI